MIKHLTASAAFATLLLLPVSALAQDAATVMVAESADHGAYLTDAEGRALYLFTNDTQGMGDSMAVVSCSGGCLDNWPPFYTGGEAMAGDMADAGLLGTVEHDGQMMVTYNGWPLYYFAGDAMAGDTAGQGRGDVWFLVSPDGEMIQ